MDNHFSRFPHTGISCNFADLKPVIVSHPTTPLDTTKMTARITQLRKNYNQDIRHLTNSDLDYTEIIEYYF